jgi:hypothetical protein
VYSVVALHRILKREALCVLNEAWRHEDVWGSEGSIELSVLAAYPGVLSLRNEPLLLSGREISRERESLLCYAMLCYVPCPVPEICEYLLHLRSGALILLLFSGTWLSCWWPVLIWNFWGSGLNRYKNLINNVLVLCRKCLSIVTSSAQQHWFHLCCC